MNVPSAARARRGLPAIEATPEPGRSAAPPADVGGDLEPPWGGHNPPAAAGRGPTSLERALGREPALAPQPAGQLPPVCRALASEKIHVAIADVVYYSSVPTTVDICRRICATQATLDGWRQPDLQAHRQTLRLMELSLTKLAALLVELSAWDPADETASPSQHGYLDTKDRLIALLMFIAKLHLDLPQAMQKQLFCWHALGQMRDLSRGELVLASLVCRQANMDGPEDAALNEALQSCVGTGGLSKETHTFAVELALAPAFLALARTPVLQEIREHITRSETLRAAAQERAWQDIEHRCDIRALRRRVMSMKEAVARRLAIQVNFASNIFPGMTESSRAPRQGDTFNLELERVEQACKALDWMLMTLELPSARRRRDRLHHRLAGLDHRLRPLPPADSPGRPSSHDDIAMVKLLTCAGRSIDALLQELESMGKQHQVLGSHLLPGQVLEYLDALKAKLAAGAEARRPKERAFVSVILDTIKVLAAFAENMKLDCEADDLLWRQVQVLDANKSMLLYLSTGLIHLTQTVSRFLAQEAKIARHRSPHAAQGPEDDEPAAGTAQADGPEPRLPEPLIAADRALAPLLAAQGGEGGAANWSQVCTPASTRRELGWPCRQKIDETFARGTFGSPLQCALYHCRKHELLDPTLRGPVADEQMQTYLAAAARAVEGWDRARALGQGYLAQSLADRSRRVRVIDSASVYLVMTDEAVPKVVSFRDRARHGF